ncbi:uncharacterized protein LOC129717640 isoform X2 [Wyeomyia smithii]|uniref:uncharacterized protein LOC129717640 isoform X2 n=1 Tax=Wyeomyia smithii TaxID=174621 RepID=UPI002467F413|nr:uncharacterized protein LOC129717640 isoform X2 [Wyeomyia smithii]
MDIPVDAQEVALPPIESFANCQYHVRVSGTTELDKRVMSFVDNLWGFEVTGGIDQFEPLTVISVRREGLARRAGIRVNDVITKINDTYADKLTLAQAQELIAESGRTVKIFVRGDVEEESEDEMTVDFWFKPLSDAERAMLDWEARMRANRNPGKWNGLWPWNNRRKVVYKESNCYMVPSVAEEKRDRELKLRVSEADYQKHLESEKAESERKLKEQRLEEAQKAEEKRRSEEEAFFAKFEAEQRRLEEQNPQKAQETDQYIEELLQQEELLTTDFEVEVSTDFPAEEN